MSTKSDTKKEMSRDIFFEEYVLNPSMRVLRSTDDEIVVQLGSRSRATHRIKDNNGHSSFSCFVEGFQEPAIPKEIAASMGIDDSTLEEYMTSLLAGNVLIPSDQRRFSLMISGLNFDQSIDKAIVQIVGEGAIGTAVARQISDLLDCDPIAPINDLSEAFNGSDIVVVAADRSMPSLFFDADELSRITGIPWHLVFLDGIELMIGPTFVPNESVNYYDFDTMDEAARVMRMPYLYGKYTKPIVEAKAPIPTFIADLAASWTTMAIGQHLWGRRSFVEGYVMRVDLERMQIIRDRVLKLPRNPADIGVQHDLRHPFL